jgi:hypothetical protein
MVNWIVRSSSEPTTITVCIPSGAGVFHEPLSSGIFSTLIPNTPKHTPAPEPGQPTSTTTPVSFVKQYRLSSK